MDVKWEPCQRTVSKPRKQIKAGDRGLHLK
jgi:hypothetical protein